MIRRVPKRSLRHFDDVETKKVHMLVPQSPLGASSETDPRNTAASWKLPPIWDGAWDRARPARKNRGMSKAKITGSRDRMVVLDSLKESHGLLRAGRARSCA